MDHVFRVIPSVLRKRGLQQHAEAALVVHRAQKWIDTSLPHLKGFLIVGSLKQTVLTVACRHSIAAQECQALLPSFLAYLKENCPFAVISEIRVMREMAQQP